MSRILIAIAAIGLLLGVMHAPVSEAATASCNWTPIVATTANPYPAVSVPSATFITVVCVQVNGQTYTAVPNGQTILPGGCYVVNKSSHAASTGQAIPGYNSGCLPIQQMTIRTVRTNASGR